MTRTISVTDVNSGTILDTIKLYANGQVTYDTEVAKPMLEAITARGGGTKEQAFLELWNSSNGYITFKGV